MSPSSAVDDGVLPVNDALVGHRGSPLAPAAEPPHRSDEVSALTVVLLDPDSTSRTVRRSALDKAETVRVIVASDVAEVAEGMRLVDDAVVIVSVDDAVLGGNLVRAVRALDKALPQPVPVIAWQSQPLPQGTPAQLHDAGADAVVNYTADADQLWSCARRLRALVLAAARQGTHQLAPVDLVLDTLPLPVARVNHDGRVSDANRSLQILWREVTGQLRSCVGMSLAEMLVPADRDAVTTAVAALCGGQTHAEWAGECVVGTTPARGIPVGLRLVRLDDAATGPMLVAHLADHREQHRVEDALATARWHALDQHQLEELSSRAHALLVATSAAAVPTDVEFSGEDTVLTFAQATVLRSAMLQGEQLLDAIRGIASNRELPASLVDIRPVVNGHLDLFRQILPEHVVLTWNGGTDDALVRGSESLLQQALTALVMNAWDAQRSGGTIHVSVSVTDDTAVVAVDDRGPGIPEERHDWVFRPLTTTRTADGAIGMGLANARRTVEMHGGRLVLDPSYETGARFEMRLPRYRARGHVAV
jgi:hypothetical protein